MRSPRPGHGPGALRLASPGLWVLIVFLAVSISACVFGGDADSDGTPAIQPGQITRPANTGLPLDNPQAVQAFDRADQLLLDWFFRRDTEAALSHISSDLRVANQPLIEGTDVEGECLLTLIEASEPDANNAVLTRYEIRDCEIVPPGAPQATHVKIGVTIADQQAWVTEIQFD